MRKRGKIQNGVLHQSGGWVSLTRQVMVEVKIFGNGDIVDENGADLAMCIRSIFDCVWFGEMFWKVRVRFLVVFHT